MRSKASGVNIMESYLGGELDMLGLSHLAKFHLTTPEIGISYLEEESILGKRQPPKPEN